MNAYPAIHMYLLWSYAYIIPHVIIVIYIYIYMYRIQKHCFVIVFFIILTILIHFICVSYILLLSSLFFIFYRYLYSAAITPSCHIKATYMYILQYMKTMLEHIKYIWTEAKIRYIHTFLYLLFIFYVYTYMYIVTVYVYICYIIISYTYIRTYIIYICIYSYIFI